MDRLRQRYIVRIDYDKNPPVEVLGIPRGLDLGKLDNWPDGTVMSYERDEWVFKSGGKDAEV